jgi:mono/diheme cytochrome c family protein
MAVCVLVAGCTDMYDDQRLKPLEEGHFFADQRSSRTLVEGTVPRGYARLDDHLFTGRVEGTLVETFPFPIDDEALDRGRIQFETFCSPCHGRLGDGMGMIVQRGFPKPNSFLTDSLRAKPVGHFFDVMTNGFGRMYSYAASVGVEDRWKIASYVRALQYRSRVDVKEIREAERGALQ